MKTTIGNISDSKLSVAEKYLYPIITSSVFILSLVSDYYIILSQFLFVSTVLMVLNRLGKGIILRELIALHGIATCIFFPIFGYTIYNQNNSLAVLWLVVMPVSMETYFSFALPAMSAFTTILCWPIRVKGLSDQGNSIQLLLHNVKQTLRERPTVGVYIMAAGLVSYFLSGFLPGSLYFVAILLFWSSFAGLLYVYFTEGYKYRKLLLLFFALFIFVSAIRSGMFTIVAYMGITLFSFFFLGKRFKLINKIIVFALAIFLLFIVQNVKHSLRQLTWRKNYKGSAVALFGNLAAEKISNTSGLFSTVALFPTYVRVNQGINVSLVMRRMPSMKPHDNGKNLMRTLAASLVPRVLWPDKPEAGGKFNMEYYAGVRIRGWSTNVGPLGEAYGSFGVAGGILYMLVLGALIRWAYKMMFKAINVTPLLLFWIPVLFYQVSSSMETDTLQILNSLFKGAFFIWLLYKLLPKWFGREKQVPERRGIRRYPIYQAGQSKLSNPPGN